MTAVDKERFDLVAIGRTSRLSKAALDRRLRERYPEIRVLKIVTAEEPYSLFASRTTDAEPRHVLTAVEEMLFARIAPKSFIRKDAQQMDGAKPALFLQYVTRETRSRPGGSHSANTYQTDTRKQEHPRCRFWGCYWGI